MVSRLLIILAIVLVVAGIAFFVYKNYIYKPPPLPNPFKTFKGDNFEFEYPENWGLLTCQNSKHFEFDPYSGVDQAGVVCDKALKPITVRVDKGECRGERVKIGNITVLKSSEKIINGREYQWCSVSTPVLEITHRVTDDNTRGTSRDDFSAQIAQMISTIRFFK